MDRLPVSSSNIASVGYDEETELLEVEFVGGRVYEYSGVPRETYDELMSASSTGSYFYRNIREGYSYTRTAKKG